ncbi:GtrA family protein [Pseudolysobacter antarcticus]|uniref:GtrA family protein n=2 Tax=Pseudolysobacter antarcticus TaxID=2511995 RepID=A0A411HQ45_9GAMM|nr:GtrA family protein [Pseudolysobacter antarcticus]
MSALSQSVRFIAVGVLQICIDSGIYIALTALGLSTPPSNLCGRIGGAAFGFWLNGKITFKRQQQPHIGLRLARYASLWIAMTIISTTLLTLIARHAGLTHAWWSKPLIEGVLGIVSFLVSRYWVYRQKSPLREKA